MFTNLPGAHRSQSERLIFSPLLFPQPAGGVSWRRQHYRPDKSVPKRVILSKEDIQGRHCNYPGGEQWCQRCKDLTAIDCTPSSTTRSTKSSMFVGGILRDATTPARSAYSMKMEAADDPAEEGIRHSVRKMQIDLLVIISGEERGRDDAKCPSNHHDCPIGYIELSHLFLGCRRRTMLHR